MALGVIYIAQAFLFRLYISLVVMCRNYFFILAFISGFQHLLRFEPCCYIFCFLFVYTYSYCCQLSSCVVLMYLPVSTSVLLIKMSFRYVSDSNCSYRVTLLAPKNSKCVFIPNRQRKTALSHITLMRWNQWVKHIVCRGCKPSTWLAAKVWLLNTWYVGIFFFSDVSFVVFENFVFLFFFFSFL